MLISKGELISSLTLYRGHLVKLNSTLAIFRIFEQIQWLSESRREALNCCFARVFLCKWPKSSLEYVAVSLPNAIVSAFLAVRSLFASLFQATLGVVMTLDGTVINY